MIIDGISRYRTDRYDRTQNASRLQRLPRKSKQELPMMSFGVSDNLRKQASWLYRGLRRRALEWLLRNRVSAGLARTDVRYYVYDPITDKLLPITRWNW